MKALMFPNGVLKSVENVGVFAEEGTGGKKEDVEAGAWGKAGEELDGEIGEAYADGEEAVDGEDEVQFAGFTGDGVELQVFGSAL